MMEACTSCGAALKVGMISANQPLPNPQWHVISLAEGEPCEVACNKCGDERYRAAKQTLEAESANLARNLKAALSSVPIVSLQQPMGWQYEPLTIVTAQTVTGTGIFSDVASAFTDLFGVQSGAYNAKLRDGENLCKASLRAQALELGGNAVLAVDVDYAEVGGQRAMLMVCMTGTAVKVTALDVPDPEFLETTSQGTVMAKRARAIQHVLQATR